MFNPLQPSPTSKPPTPDPAEYRWGYVTGLAPLRVQLDNETNETQPATLVDAVVGERVLVLVRGRRGTVLGRVPPPPPATPAWQTYSVQFYSATGGTNPTMGNSTLVGRYLQLHDTTIHLNIYFQAGSTINVGTGPWGVTLPVPARTDVWQVLPLTANVTGASGLGDYAGTTKIEGASGVARIHVDDKTNDARMSVVGGGAGYIQPASGNRLIISGTYEAQ